MFRRPGRVVSTLPVSIAALVVALVTIGAMPDRLDASALGLRFPAPMGTQWQIVAGYNTPTHTEVDAYAIDLVRTDGRTEGTPVLAPVSGVVGYVGSDCFSIRTDTATILICHVLTDPGVRRGQPVAVGQRLATVAPPGEAGNFGYPHIHLAVNEYTPTRRGTSGPRGSLPFVGDYQLEGISLPATSEPNAYYLRRFTSTNDPSLAIPRASAGADRTVDAGEPVTLVATVHGGSGPVTFGWQQLTGPGVTLSGAGGATATFVAPDAPGVDLGFRVWVQVGSEVTSADVAVTVRDPATIAEARGRIIGGAVYRGGVSMVLFSGGSNEELVDAVACDLPVLSFWAAIDGAYVGFIPGALVPSVNAAWAVAYPDGLPANLPLVVRCA